MLGLPHGQNFLTDYSDDWPRLFQEEKSRIASVADGRALTIEHIGSTAVPRIKAKPVIDIAIAIADLSIADDLAAAMATIGYDYPGDIGIPDHRIFGRDKDVRRYLVHVLEHAVYRWSDLISFRDILRTNARLAHEYEQLKLDAVAQHPTDRAQYTESKSQFVQRILTPSQPHA